MAFKARPKRQTPIRQLESRLCHIEKKLDLLNLAMHFINKKLDKLGTVSLAKAGFTYKVRIQGKKETYMPLEVTLTNEQKLNVTLSPVTATGKTAKLDGAPEWVVSSGPATLVTSPDGLSSDIVSSDEDLTDTIVQVNADADLGQGVETISDTITVHTIHANASNLGLTAGAPVAK